MNKQSSIRTVWNSTASRLTISAVVLSLTSQGFAQSYTVVDLGTLGGDESFARDINNAGQITGDSFVNSASDVLAFIWQDGVMFNIGSLNFPKDYSYASAINNSAQICGVSPIENNSQHAYLWQDGVMQDLGTLGGTQSYAYDINSFGDVVGWSNPPGSYVRNAVLWSGGKIVDLGVLVEGFKNTARGINNIQEIVGYGTISSGIPRGFLWRNEEMTVLPMLEGATKSTANKINDDGAIVGHMKVAEGNWHPVIWLTNDYPKITIVDLGLPEKFSSGACQNLNNVGQVVGWYSESCGEEDACPRPFIWENGELQMLNDLIPADSGWDLRSITAINDLGQIVGRGLPPGGDPEARHAFLLNPIIPGDLDGDLAVDLTDLILLINAWGPCVDCNNCPADLDDDCVVGVSDLLALFSNWG